MFKRKAVAWNLSASDLLQFPANTLGYQVGLFLEANQFELIDKLESHDVYHVICQMDTTVKDEIGMQYLLMGNGKKSVYQKLTVILGFCLLPEYFSYFKFCYAKGKEMHPVFLMDIKAALHLDYEQLLNQLNIQKRHHHLKLFNLIKY